MWPFSFCGCTSYHLFDSPKVNPDTRIIIIRYKKTKPEHEERLKKKNIWKEDTVTLRVANGEYLHIPVSWLEKQSVLSCMSLDLKDPKVTGEGYNISLGELEFSSAVLISNWTKS